MVPDYAHRTVNLDNVKQNNIVVIDLSKELTETVFENEYQKTAQIIKNILSHKMNANYLRNRDGKGKKCFEDLHATRTELQTVVPFIGDRGSGKTSMMYSVLKRLDTYGDSDEIAAFNLGKENDGVHFISLDMIDANALKRTEDVLEIILSRMLSYLERISGEHDFHELYRKIDSLYKDLSRVKWKKSFSADEPSIMSLKQIADSQKSIESFQQLVVDFTSRISEIKNYKLPCYLVIAIDDIDMYQGSGNGMRDSQFALLDQIYNYMRIPGLIVLLTYNESILKRNCIRHFRETYFEHSTYRTCTLAEKDEIDLLTRQFMAKLFPQEQRVYMPNFLFVDSANQSNLYIKPVITNNMGKVEGIAPFTEDTEIPVKDFMLRLIAYKTGVYFDAAGSKKHFFEPRNLRELGAMFQIVAAMTFNPEEDPEYQHSQNRQVLLNYLYNQFSGERLNAEEYRSFRNLSMLPLERQGRNLIDSIRQQRLLVAPQEDDVGYLPKTTRDRWKYSYGELLHNIYYATRIRQKVDSEETFRSKNYVHCILGTHSVVLNQTLHTPRARRDILEYIGPSISGRWANKMLPEFSIADRRSESAGSISLPIARFFNFRIPSNVQNAIINLGSGKGSDEDRKHIKQFIKAMVIVGMFFTGFPKNGLKIQLEARGSQEEGAVLLLHSTSKDHICFNVFNFVINLYTACTSGSDASDCYLLYIKTKLSKLGTNIGEQLNKSYIIDRDEAQTAIKDAEQQMKEIPESRRFDRKALLDMIAPYREKLDIANAWIKMLGSHEFSKDIFVDAWECLLEEVIGDGKTTGEYTRMVKKWEEQHKENPLILPVQHFDMMYNIIKRLADSSYHDIPEEAPVGEVFDYYIHLYKNLKTELGNQDNVYLNETGGGFEEAYCSSLFYREVTAEEASDNFNPYIKEILVAMMRAVLPAKQIRTDNIAINSATMVPAYPLRNNDR